MMHTYIKIHYLTVWHTTPSEAFLLMTDLLDE